MSQSLALGRSEGTASWREEHPSFLAEGNEPQLIGNYAGLDQRHQPADDDGSLPGLVHMNRPLSVRESTGSQRGKEAAASSHRYVRSLLVTIGAIPKTVKVLRRCTLAGTG